MYEAGYYKEVGESLNKAPHNAKYNGRIYINADKDPAIMAALGYVWMTAAEVEAWHAAHPAPVVERQRCTRYQLVNCLETHYPTLLTTFRTIYDSDTENGRNLRFYWNSVNDLDRNDTKFKAAQAALGITDEQVAEIFSKIEGEEPAAMLEVIED